MSGLGVIVVGSVNADLTIALPHAAQPGETVLGSGGNLAMGGKGFNQALAARRYGARTQMIGSIGDDAFGRQALAEMMAAGIDASSMIQASGMTTGAAAILVTPGGVNTIAVAPGANATLGLDDVRAALMGGPSSVVVAQLEVPVETVAEAFKIAKSQGSTTILNPAPAHDRSAALFATTDIIIPNEFELAELAGTPPVISEDMLRKACRRLVDQGIKVVIATLGSRGCAIFGSDRLTTIPAYEVVAIDSSGAGDTFVGTFAAAVAGGGDLHAAAITASAAAALSVMQRGAASSPDRAALDAFLRSRGHPTIAALQKNIFSD